MNIEQTFEDGLSKDFIISYPKEAVDEAIENILKGQLHTISLPGFRAGKAPLSLVKKRYGAAFLQQALEGLYQKGLDELFSKQGFNQENSNLNVIPEEYKPDGGFKIKVETDLHPEIKLMDFSKISLTRMKPTASKAKIDEMLAMLANENPVKKEVKRAAKSGDRIVIDFEGSLDGELFDGGKAEDAELEIGAGQFIPGFEENFIGRKAGDDVGFDITFPEDYQAENLAGKTTHFDCKVKKLFELQPRQADDALAVDLGLTDLAELTEKMRENYTNQLAGQAQEKLRIDLMDELDAQHQCELPPRMVEREFEAIWPRIRHAMEHDHLEEEDKGKDEETLKADYKAIASRRVKLGLLMSIVAKQADVNASDEEIQQYMITQITNMPPQQQQQMIQMMQNDRQRLVDMYRGELLENKTVDYIIEQANISEEEIDGEAFHAKLNEESEGEAGAKTASDKPASKKKAAPKKKAGTAKAKTADKPADKPAKAKTTASKKTAKED